MIFFDIETESNPDAIQYIDKPTAPSNYKDEEKIAAYVEEKMQELIERAPLDPDYGKIVAIGVKENADPIHALIAGIDVETEEALLKWFWNKYKSHNGVSCGYNILGFDLPYLMRRSFALGVPLGCTVNLAKYRSYPTVDVMALLYNWSYSKGLKWVAKRYNLDNPLPDVDGSMVAEMDPDMLRLYVTNDVYLVYQLYQRMKGVYC